MVSGGLLISAIPRNKIKVRYGSVSPLADTLSRETSRIRFISESANSNSRAI